MRRSHTHCGVCAGSSPRSGTIGAFPGLRSARPSATRRAGPRSLPGCLLPFRAWRLTPAWSARRSSPSGRNSAPEEPGGFPAKDSAERWSPADTVWTAQGFLPALQFSASLRTWLFLVTRGPQVVGRQRVGAASEQVAGAQNRGGTRRPR